MFTNEAIMPNVNKLLAPAIAAKTGNPLALMLDRDNDSQPMNPLMMAAMMGRGPFMGGVNPGIAGAFQNQYGPMNAGPGINPNPDIAGAFQGYGGGGNTSGGNYNFDYTDSGDASLESIVAGIIQSESGGNPNARNPMPGQTAGGLGQFIDSTWLAMLDQHRPDLRGLSRGEKLNLKFNPELNKAMTREYVSANIEGLKNAGIYKTPGDAYVAHFLGLGGAKKVLSAPPGTPLTSLLSEQIFAANPMRWRGKGLRQMTAGELRQMFHEKMTG